MAPLPQTGCRRRLSYWPSWKSAASKASWIRSGLDPDPLALLPPPLPLGTAEDKPPTGESTLRIYTARTRKRLRSARASTRSRSSPSLPPLGRFSGRERFRRPRRFCGSRGRDQENRQHRYKNSVKRPRPFVADPARFAEPGDPEKSPGYPSGHSTRGTVFAPLLAEIFRAARSHSRERSRHRLGARRDWRAHAPRHRRRTSALGQALGSVGSSCTARPSRPTSPPLAPKLPRTCRRRTEVPAYYPYFSHHHENPPAFFLILPLLRPSRRPCVPAKRQQNTCPRAGPTRSYCWPRRRCRARPRTQPILKPPSIPTARRPPTNAPAASTKSSSPFFTSRPPSAPGSRRGSFPEPRRSSRKSRPRQDPRPAAGRNTGSESAPYHVDPARFLQRDRTRGTHRLQLPQRPLDARHGLCPAAGGAVSGQA